MTQIPIQTVADVIKDVFKRDCNAHIFINSVDYIAKMIDKASLTTDQVRVVCSKSGESLIINSAKLGAIPIESTKDPVKKINFYTSTSFEGCDILDEKGMIFIVAIGHKEHTLLDIGTTFMQACGRIRNTKYRDKIQFIFSSSYSSNRTTAQQSDLATARSQCAAQRYCQMINSLSDTEKRIHLNIHHDTTALNKKYIKEIDGHLIVDRNRLNYER